MTTTSVNAQLFADACDAILDGWLRGLSIREAAEACFLDGSKAYMYLTRYEPMKSKFAAAKEQKALQMIDQACEWAQTAGSKGAAMLDASLINIGVNHATKAASKLDPRAWGDKSQLELSGGLQVEQNTTITPADAYERMIKGA